VLLLGGTRLQRSVVKAAYSRNRRGASWGAHGIYLAREGAQREGAKGLGFDADHDDVDLAATLRSWQQAGDQRLWKFIVSPEHGERLDLHAHTRALVSQMERDLGTPLEWAAIDHHNTDNPHVHLLVRGRDAAGRPLEIAPEYLKTGLRARSQDLATAALGWRSEREQLVARSRAVERIQFTEIDRALLGRAGADHVVSYEGPRPRTRHGEETRLQELRRLRVLEGLGLAEKTGARTWRLSQALESTLRQAQLAGDILKSRARHLPHLSDPRLPLVVTSLEAGASLTGRLVGTGLADELHDRRYLLLEGDDRRLHYLLQPPTVERARGGGRLRLGDVVTVSGHGTDRRGRQIVETRMNVQPTTPDPTGRPTERARGRPEAPPLPSLRQVERSVGRPIAIAPSIDGLLYRGQLVGYARGDDQQPYAVVDMNPELIAVRTEQAELTPGQKVRATAHEVEEDRRRRLIWRLDDERQQQRERGL
jgi:type IV secretory pathway VirD2 relaxase